MSTSIRPRTRASVKRQASPEPELFVENPAFAFTQEVTSAALPSDTTVKVEAIDETSRQTSLDQEHSTRNSKTSFKKNKREHVEVKIEEICSESIPQPSESPNVFLFADPSDAPESAPRDWALIYNEVAKMRSKFLSPVDHHGCVMMPETLGSGIKHRDPRTYRFQLLISLMLSAQTKDEVNFQAMDTLHRNFLAKGYKGGLCLQAILDSSEAYIDECIAKVGFHRKKASYIKRSCQLIHDQFNGDIPNTIEDIVLMPGVGPKMGYLLLQLGWGINHGIGVDVHIHRLAQMWGWTSKKAKTPEQTRLELQDWLPKKYWADLNPLLVGFGQTVCAPNANNCDVCTLSTTGLCKAANKKLMRTPISPKRLVKLQKQRSDLTPLVPVQFMIKEEVKVQIDT